MMAKRGKKKCEKCQIIDHHDVEDSKQHHSKNCWKKKEIQELLKHKCTYRVCSPNILKCTLVQTLFQQKEMLNFCLHLCPYLLIYLVLVLSSLKPSTSQLGRGGGLGFYLKFSIWITQQHWKLCKTSLRCHIPSIPVEEGEKQKTLDITFQPARRFRERMGQKSKP